MRGKPDTVEKSKTKMMNAQIFTNIFTAIEEGGITSGVRLPRALVGYRKADILVRGVFTGWGSAFEFTSATLLGWL